MWYETEQIEEPVLPFCSMLYQLAGKCNVELKPSGRYNPNALYNLEEGNFLVDVCSTVKSLNEEMAGKQSWLKKWSDDIRMTRKSMSPGAKAGFVLGTLFLAAMTVTACLYANMRELESKAQKLQPYDIQEIPDFDYENAQHIERKDSGVHRARTAQPRRRAPSPLRLERNRTFSDFR